ncbi:MAG: DUF3341 domain-containing protein [Deinococcales bacterium]
MAELYGVVAQYGSPDAVKAAAQTMRDHGYLQIEAYTPYPIEGLDDDLGQTQTRLGWVVLAMGMVGFIVGFGMQWWANVEFYPLNIGGKPLNSWPNFIVITFECTIIFSAFTAGLFMLFRNGLPQYYHPIFNTPGFENATRDKFFLCVEAQDKHFELAEVKGLLASTHPEKVSEVEK